ncbi:UDP-3-O-(3-hydroxymyristoyl)glucosamine N-acyltransferase [Nitrincola alkalilacustris]|uniref:UDP-3-O-(3-hydroxymyristoyl)glucosamine N-acyltransferase n=1 Tax=Nitrincola alkalilacustris TaxID=1571224 RepID=UPI00124E5412|nr:UDP-3-O-(3-hydroxymyristoyl)glucosamine N-acyltransferase [Nitrincola alkalilacustris]
MTARHHYSLVELAAIVDGSVQGEINTVITGLATLKCAGQGHLSFFSNTRYLKDLQSSDASAVLVHADHAADVRHAAVVVKDPYLAFAKLSALFDWRQPLVPGIAATAVVEQGARIEPSAEISHHAVVGEGAQISAEVYIGANSVIGSGCHIGPGSRIEAGVVVYPGTKIGARVIIHSGAIVGSDGFGFAPEAGTWRKIYQTGGVSIGDDVEIGAGVTIDRGALDDTVIDSGVKLDNQVHVAHNVVIGEHTAIAGCTGIAGSTKIGSHCTIAGMAGIGGHLNIVSNTHITAMTMVSKSISEPGVYSSGIGMGPHKQWKRNVIRFRQLDEMAKRIRTLEQSLEQNSTEGCNDDGCK